ncbi:MAG: hypothetical protein GWP74_10120, partial [Proteobacteria bacterium]|nr:hypothetical protein [Pseudomonadota bacterium]
LETVGRASEGIDILDGVIELSERSRQKFFLSELHRLRGVLQLREARTEDAEISLKRALDVARRQNAKSLELRAGVCLGRAWMNSPSEEHVVEVLTEVHDWFSEGTDSRDFKEAEDLLQGTAADH